MELLERQFPIESPIQRMKLRSPIDFANQLAVHVNHLNRAIKETMGKTTSAGGKRTYYPGSKSFTKT